MRRQSYEQLAEAVQRATEARACIAQNTGPDKDLAREGYDYAVGELAIEMGVALRDLAGDADPRDLEKLAVAMMKLVSKLEAKS